VQLQTLTAVVKLFLQKPDGSQGLVQRVLNTATRDCDSPDVRDRAYIYWRLLSTDPGAAKVRTFSVLITPIPTYEPPESCVGPSTSNIITTAYSSACSLRGTDAGIFNTSQRVSQAVKDVHWKWSVRSSRTVSSLLCSTCSTC
jgi:AP-1 complex subunit beta-1